jgi:hypothetical protein
MRLEISRLEGLRNDLLLRLERREIDAAVLSVSDRKRLMALPGIPRHRQATPTEHDDLSSCRIPIQAHLAKLGILGASGALQRRAIAVSNRNLGTNHGNLAWQRAETPHVFRVMEDPCDYPAYSCLTSWRSGMLTIEDLRFDVAADRVYDARSGTNLSGDIEWATFGQRMLRAGALVSIDAIADQFYDIRHVLAFEHHRAEGEAIRRAVYQGYPGAFRENVRRAWRQLGVPRARYFHNAIGLSSDAVFVLQREGTIEEIGAHLLRAGADDGIILDNGGSIVCWAWWVNDYTGGTISTTVDYRPDGTSAIAISPTVV